MAKLQGHLMKHRDSCEKCVENVKELLESDDNTLNDMTVAEWLDRLNLSKY